VIETSQFTPKAGMVDLGIGQPQLELLPHDLMRQAACRVLTGQDNACLNYGPARGNGYLRLALAEFLGPRYGCAVDPATLMATGGASQALSMIASALAQPGDTVLVEEPTYFLAHRVFSDCGLRVVGVPIGADGLQPEELEAAIERHRPKLLYTIPVHQNPSGVIMAAQHRRAIVDMCARHGVLIVADEVYQLLTYQGSPPPPLAAYLDSEAVISVGSFSKILAPGLRLGWIQAAESLLGRLTSLGVFASGGGVNHFTGCLVQDVLASGGQASYLDGLLATYGRRVDLLDRLLTEHLGDRVVYRRPEGGYFFWLRLADGRDALALLERAGEEKVGYRSGVLFSTIGSFRDHLRLSFAHYGDEALQHGVERLARVLA
jgi:DNA-binding transcriptional MocR family regulator